MNLQQQLMECLDTLNPSHLEIINESANHGGYYPGKESHFKVIIVSQIFQGMRAVQRHQKVYGAVQSLLAAGGGS
ncbi:BolA family protein, partial [Acinetobacter nectaris]|uniref:BolA family protein n=1 Tax=Acinetobacter nectaris TaxID=1219382 RepID=UPI001F348AD7